MSIDIVSIPKVNKVTSENKERIYDNDGFSLRASCIIWDSKTQNRVMLIKNKKNRWCIPGGAVEEKDETILSAAIREIEEEAGIKGDILNYIGNFKDYGKNNHSIFVWNIISKYELENYKENYRERKWFTIEDAIKLLEYKPTQLQMLLNSKKMIYRNNNLDKISEIKIKEYKEWSSKIKV